MPITVTCKNCGKQFRAKDSLSGRSVKCPGCSSRLKVSASPPESIGNAETLTSQSDNIKQTPSTRDQQVKPITQSSALDDYKIVSELGRGGMGVVKKAFQKSLKRHVALKMVLPGRGQQISERQLGRFYAEAEAVAKLQHSNIVQIHEIGESDGQPFFSMEYVEGGTLEDAIGNDPQDERETAQIVEQLANAMGFAHQRRVIHRDLKPANVLISEDGSPKITDFGLAKMAFGDDDPFAEFDDEYDPTDSQIQRHGMTVAGKAFGTPGYMAPEQATGDLDSISAATDIYALGAILYKLLTGRPPFVAKNLAQMLRQVQHDEPIAPRDLEDDVSEDLQAICLQCLEKDPEDRYVNAHELVDDLRRFLAGVPVEARPVGGFEAIWMWGKRNSQLAVMGAAFAAAVVIGVIVAVGFAVVANRSAMEANQQKKLAVEQSGRANASAAKAQLEKERADKERDEAQRLQHVAEKTAEELRQALALVEKEKQRADKETRNAEIERETAIKQTQLASERSKSLKRASYIAQVRRASNIESNDSDAAIRLLQDTKVCAVESRDFSWNLAYRRAKGEQPRIVRRQSGAAIAAALTPDGKSALFSGHNSPGAKSRPPDFAHEFEIQQFENSEKQAQAIVVNGLGMGPMRISSDSRFVSSSRSGNFNCFDLKQNKVIIPGIGVTGVCSSPNNDFAVAFSKDGPETSVYSILYRINLDENQENATCRIGTESLGQIRAGAISNDGKWLALGGDSIRIVNYKVETNVKAGFRRRVAKGLVQKAYMVPDGGNGSPTQSGDGITIQSMIFSPDDKYLITGTNDSRIIFWKLDEENGRAIQESNLRGQTGSIEFIAISPDDRLIATGSSDNAIKLWDFEQRTEILTIAGVDEPINSLSFTNDGSFLAAGVGGELHVWNGSPPSHIATLPVPGTVPNQQLAFTADGESLATASFGHRKRGQRRGVQKSIEWSKVDIGNWDVHTAQKIEPPADNQSELWQSYLNLGRNLIQRVSVFPNDGSYLLLPASAANSNSKLQSQWLVIDVTAHKSIASLRFSTSDESFLSSCYSPASGLLGLAKGSTVNLMSLGSDEVQPFPPGTNWEPNHKMDDRKPIIERGNSIATIDCGGYDNHCAISRDGSLFAAWDKDQTLAVWDVRIYRKIKSFQVFREGIAHVAFSPDGQHLGTMNHEGTLTISNLESEKQQQLEKVGEVYLHRGHRWAPFAFSADGKWLAAPTSVEPGIGVWKLEDGSFQPKFVAKVHPDGARFTPDSRFLIANSTDKLCLHLWDLESETLRGTLCSTNQVRGDFAITTDGRHLASVVADPGPDNAEGAAIELWDLRQASIEKNVALAGESKSKPARKRSRNKR